MEYVRINATMPAKILKQVDEYAEQMQEDRSTAIRQLIAKALLGERKAQVLDAFRNHKLTVRETAQALGLDYWDLQHLLEKEGIPITDLTDNEIGESKKMVNKLKSKIS